MRGRGAASGAVRERLSRRSACFREAWRTSVGAGMEARSASRGIRSRSSDQARACAPANHQSRRAHMCRSKPSEQACAAAKYRRFARRPRTLLHVRCVAVGYTQQQLRRLHDVPKQPCEGEAKRCSARALTCTQGGASREWFLARARACVCRAWRAREIGGVRVPAKRARRP